MTDTPRDDGLDEAFRRMHAHVDSLAVNRAERRKKTTTYLSAWVNRVDIHTMLDKEHAALADAKLRHIKAGHKATVKRAAAGPRDEVLPPPDLSLIDTLGEGADPDRPVRIKAAGPRDDKHERLVVAALRYYADTMPGYAAAAGLTQEEYAAVMVDVRRARAALAEASE